jgi:hypothetical protein
VRQKIALMGVSGAGKDYLASYLIDNHEFTRFSFSDQLKRLAQLIYPWLEVDYPPLVKEESLDIKLPTGETIKKSPRQIWLHLNSLREIEQHIFIRMLDEEVTQADKVNGHNNILISDIRSTDELNWCQRNKFKVIYINNAKAVYQPYDIDSQILENKDKADFVFVNKHNGISDFEAFYKSNISFY